MKPLVLAALLPGLFWQGEVSTAPKVKQAGIARLHVPPAKAAAWKAAGFEAIPYTLAEPACAEADMPRVQMRMDVAAATGMPWIDANGWRFLRRPARAYCYKELENGAALAAAEAYAYAVQSVVAAPPAELADFGRMLAFLRRIDRPALPALANFGIVDDGSDETAEVFNLMTRRNLLYRVLKAPDPRLDLNLTPKAVSDPYEYALQARRTLGDGKRLVRLYGTEVVIAHLTGDGRRARLHLLNYSHRPVLGLRVRVLGDWRAVALAIFGKEKAAPGDISRRDGATEFTVPEMGAYAVADLQ